MKYQDQMQREVQLDESPQRIVSLVPSQTELLHALGLGERVVGVTKFCIHPDAWYRGKHRVGGTKDVSFEKVHALRPDLILGNKEENEKRDIEALEQSYPVWMSDIYDLSDALEMIRKVGELTGTQERAEEMISEIETRFADLDVWVKENQKTNPSVAYFIWKDPDYCAGPDTFIDRMLKRCGFENFITKERYPELTPDGSESPDYLFLSSEPFPFKKKHVDAFQQRFPNSKIKLVDGEMFSWYGSRLTQAPKYFQSLLEELAAD